MSRIDDWLQQQVEHEVGTEDRTARDLLKRARRWHVLNDRILPMTIREHATENDRTRERAVQLSHRNFQRLEQAARSFRRAWLRAKNCVAPLPDYDDNDAPRDVALSFALFYTDSERTDK